MGYFRTLESWARNRWSYGILYSISSVQKGTAAFITQTVHSDHQIFTAVSALSIVYPSLHANLPLTSHSQALHARPTHVQCNHLHPCQIVGMAWYHARHANAKTIQNISKRSQSCSQHSTASTVHLISKNSWSMTCVLPSSWGATPVSAMLLSNAADFSLQRGRGKGLRESSKRTWTAARHLPSVPLRVSSIG